MLKYQTAKDKLGISESNLVKPPDRKRLKIDQLAERLQVPKSWVYEQTRKRHSVKNPIPCHLVGKHIRFYEHEIDAWLDCNTQSGSLKFKGIKKSEL